MKRLASGWVVLMAALVAPWPAGAGDGVSGVDSRDTFVVHAGSAAAGGSGGDGCQGCATVIAVPVCASGIIFESPAPGSGCLEIGSRDCRAGELFVRQWTTGPAGWIQGGVSCLDPGATVTVADLAVRVRDAVAHRVPPPAVTTQPRRRPLVSLPVLLRSGQPDGQMIWQDTVAGVPVTTRVSATWRWDFGDGGVLLTHQAGSSWPDTAVSHTFDDPGEVNAAVTATWSGTFEIAGLGPRPIEGVVTQRAAKQLRIRTAGAVLQPAIR